MKTREEAEAKAEELSLTAIYSPDRMGIDIFLTGAMAMFDWLSQEDNWIPIEQFKRDVPLSYDLFWFYDPDYGVSKGYYYPLYNVFNMDISGLTINPTHFKRCIEPEPPKKG